ncbi:inositol monophosphatase family protein [Amaricoccus macauensis]|uniref:inositol monophosphatase family protein n=1 Tax=Amaricoccus macauensis TaxID=57001 RepID=UPI003C7D7F00
MIDQQVRERFDLAQTIAEEAGRLAFNFWQNRENLAVEAKGGAQDVVSEADRTIERLVREKVGKVFPQDGFLGEEYGFETGQSEFIWVIDPIDGTSPFLHGLPNWCVAIAVLKGGECVAAVTEVPTNTERFAAIKGGGMLVNGKLSRISPDLTVGTGIVGLGASAYSVPQDLGIKVEQLLGAGGMFYRNGSGAQMLAYVAAGRLAGYYETVMYPWDCLGGLLMVHEAGGQSLPLAHDPTESKQERVLTAAPGAWDELSILFAT